MIRIYRTICFILSFTFFVSASTNHREGELPSIFKTVVGVYTFEDISILVETAIDEEDFCTLETVDRILPLSEYIRSEHITKLLSRGTYNSVTILKYLYRTENEIVHSELRQRLSQILLDCLPDNTVKFRDFWKSFGGSHLDSASLARIIYKIASEELFGLFGFISRNYGDTASFQYSMDLAYEFAEIDSDYNAMKFIRDNKLPE